MRISRGSGYFRRWFAPALIAAFVLLSQSPAHGDPVVGATNGAFEVTPDGQAAYSASIEVPPGIQGLAPQISIAWSSGGANGLLGLGGQLSGISAVTRCGATFAQDGFAGGVNHDSNDRYCLGGDRLILISGTEGGAGSEYRTEIESFQKIVANGASGGGPQSFTVQTKGGGKMFFGATADSRVQHPQTGTVHRWWISRLEDVNGNYIEYEYGDFTSAVLGFTETERLPAEIRYGGNDGQSVSPHLSVVFEYEPRTDHVRAFSNGMAFKVTQRIASIKTYAGGGLVRDYQFSYDYSPDTHQSRLIAVTECAYDGSCYNPTTFTWNASGKDWLIDNSFSAPDDLLDSQGGFRGVLADLDNDGRTEWVTAVIESTGSTQLDAWSSSESGWVSAGGLQPPAALFDYASAADGVSIGDLTDLNGDGLVDWVVAYGDTSGGFSEAWLNTGSGWSANAAYRAPFVLSRTDTAANGEMFGQFVDLNGDALPDYLVATRDNASVVTQSAWLNTGSGWSASAGFAPPSLLYDYSTNANGIQRGRVFDVSGDGLPDFVIAVKNADSSFDIATWLNTGTGWNRVAGYDIPSVFVSYANDPEGRGFSGLSDVNGDGLADVTLAYELNSAQTVSTWLNTGAGWQASTGYAAPGLAVRYQSDGAADALGSFIDVTGDGLVDFVQAYKTTAGTSVHAVWRNTNPGWVRDDSYALPVALVEHVTAGASLPRGTTGDANGDGYTDVILSRAGQSATTYVATADGGSAIQPQAIDRVVNGLGFETTVEYAPTTQAGLYQPGAQGAYPDIAGNGISWLVSAVEADDGIGGKSRVEHSYGGAKVNLLGRGSLGFAWREVFDTRTNITMRSEFEQAFPYIGQLKYSEKTHGSTRIFESVQTHDHLALNSGKTFFPFAASKVVDAYELDGAHISTVESTSVYDSHGNNTSATSTTSDATGVYSKTIDNTFSDDLGNWILGKLQSVTTTLTAPGTPSITRRTDYQSDALGRVTEQVVEPLHSQAVTTTFQYDGFGNRTQTTVSAADIATRTSSVAYSADGRFPVTLTNAIGDSATQEFDGRFGKITRKTDANGQVKETLYNAFGIKLKDIDVRQTDPNNEGDGEETVLFTWCGTANNCPEHAVYFVTAADNQGESPEAAYFDVFSREIRTTAFGFSGETIYKKTEYDEFGRKHRVSELHFDGDPPNWTTTEYDVLGRPVQVTHPNGAVTTITHQGRTTEVENALNQVNTKTVNANGKPVQTVDAHGNITQLSYDTAGNLTQTQDPHGNIITNTYDLFGRKTAMDDPDMGAWEYQYDSLGNLVYQKDAKGQEVTITYDLLNRRISRSEPEGNTQWIYDTAPNGKGRLAQVTQSDAQGANYVRDHAYDQFGRPSQEHVTIDGQVYTTNWFYQGTTDRVDHTEYPSGLVVRRTYNDFAFPDGVRVSGLETIQDYTQAQANAQQLADDHNDLVTVLAPQHDAEVEQANGLIAQAKDKEGDARRAQNDANAAIARYKGDLARANQYAGQANNHYRTANNYSKQAERKYAEIKQVEAACTNFDIEDSARVGWCGWAANNHVPRLAGLIDSYQALAEQYKRRGDSAAGKANSYSRSARSHAEDANAHAAVAQSKMNQANDLYAQAQVHVNAAEALRAQIDESYRQWDEANTEANRLYDLYISEGSILVWSAQGADAEGRVTAYQQGNGVATNVEYYAQSGRIKRVSADVTDQQNFTSQKIQDYRDQLIARITATADEFSSDVIGYQTERNNAQVLKDAAGDNADAAGQALNIYEQTGDNAKALFARAETQRYEVEAEVQELNRELNDNLIQIHNGTVAALQGLIAGYGTVAVDMNQNHALEIEYHNLMAAHYHLVEALYQNLSVSGQSFFVQYEGVYLEPTQDDLDGFAALSLNHEDLSILNELRAGEATESERVSSVDAWTRAQEMYKLYGDVLGNLSGATDQAYEPGRHLNIGLGESYNQAGETGIGGFFTSRDTLGQPRVDFYGDLSALYQQRSTDTQSIIDLLVNEGGEYAPVIDHNLVAELNISLSQRYAEMATIEYWDDFSQTLGADFGELSGLYDTIAQQNADLAAGHEQQALEAHNAYDHTLLVFNGVIQDQTFIYDQLGNLTERYDDATELVEAFQYDQLNRVTSHSRFGAGAELYGLAGLANISFQYDALGNITNRSDVGTYQYGNQAGPHAVTAISGGEAYHKNTTYAYDANGNQTAGDGRTVAWASFNKPTTISRNGSNVEMFYGPERRLYRQIENDSQGSRTITYVGGLYEKEVSGTQTAHRYHIAVGNEVMAVLVDNSDELPDAHYFHRDHLNSIVAVSDKNGYVIERYHYDAFGQRYRAVNETDPIGNLLNAVTDRGYTGHSHLSLVGLVNMQGRLYDATIGRFISADPFIQAPLFSQSYNRYSYVLNNPLKLVDPSGYLFGLLKKLLKTIKRIVTKIANVISTVVAKIGSFVKTYWRPILAVTVAVAVSFALPAAMPAVLKGAIAGGLGGFVSTGSLKGAFIGAMTGAAFAGIGQALGGLELSSSLTKMKDIGHHWGTTLNNAGRAVKAFSHGMVGGLSSAASGGKFMNGFLSAGVTAGFSPSIAARFPGDDQQILRIVAGGGLGGITAELAGGKFGDGFVTGAYSTWFNQEGASLSSGFSRKVGEYWNRFEESVRNYFVRPGEATAIGIGADMVVGGGGFSVGFGYAEFDLDGDPSTIERRAIYYQYSKEVTGLDMSVQVEYMASPNPGKFYGESYEMNVNATTLDLSMNNPGGFLTSPADHIYAIGAGPGAGGHAASLVTRPLIEW